MFEQGVILKSCLRKIAPLPNPFIVNANFTLLYTSFVFTLSYMGVLLF